MSFLIVPALLLFIVSAKAQQNFYWREFNGTIPIDAVPGGNDDKGEATYIGMAFFPDNQGIITSVIYKGDDTCHTHLGPYYLTSRINAQILCSGLSTRPIWKVVNLNNVHRLGHCNFIKGGYHENAVLRIGRIKKDGRYYAGKVFPAEHKYAGLEIWTTEHVGAIRDFEMLGYCDFEGEGNHAIKVPIDCVSCLL